MYYFKPDKIILKSSPVVSFCDLKHFKSLF